MFTVQIHNLKLTKRKLCARRFVPEMTGGDTTGEYFQREAVSKTTNKNSAKWFYSSILVTRESDCRYGRISCRTAEYFNATTMYFVCRATFANVRVRSRRIESRLLFRYERRCSAKEKTDEQMFLHILRFNSFEYIFLNYKTQHRERKYNDISRTSVCLRVRTLSTGMQSDARFLILYVTRTVYK